MAHTHLITMIVRRKYVSSTGSALNSFNDMQRIYGLMSNVIFKLFLFLWVFVFGQVIFACHKL